MDHAAPTDVTSRADWAPPDRVPYRCDVEPWSADACPGLQARIAHLSPDTPPIDFCVGLVGLENVYAGPILRSAIPAGIAYGQVTQYIEGRPTPRHTMLRLVRGGATDCATPLRPDLTDFMLPQPPGCRAQGTLALIGQLHGTGERALHFVTFPDTRAPEDLGERVMARVIHAAPDLGPVDVAIDTLRVTVWPSAYYGTVAVPNLLLPRNCFGFAFADPREFQGASFTVRRARTVEAPLGQYRFDPTPGAVYSVFLVGLLRGIGDRALGALVCQDFPVVTTTDGLNSTCNLMR